MSFHPEQAPVLKAVASPRSPRQGKHGLVRKMDVCEGNFHTVAQGGGTGLALAPLSLDCWSLLPLFGRQLAAVDFHPEQAPVLKAVASLRTPRQGKHGLVRKMDVCEGNFHTVAQGGGTGLALAPLFLDCWSLLPLSGRQLAAVSFHPEQAPVLKAVASLRSPRQGDPDC